MLADFFKDKLRGLKFLTCSVVALASLLVFSYQDCLASVHEAVLKLPKSTCGCIPAELQNLSYALYPDSPDYNTERLNYNKCFVYFPKAIFLPTTKGTIEIS